ncbi:hypothetical protein H4S06_003222, partial [Coemansia sp. BCRC 34490]
LDAIKRETRRLLLASASSAPSDAAGSNSALYQVWLDRLNAQSYDPVSPRLFDQVVRELQTEGLINVVGSGRNMLIVVKQSAVDS